MSEETSPHDLGTQNDCDACEQYMSLLAEIMDISNEECRRDASVLLDWLANTLLELEEETEEP